MTVNPATAKHKLEHAGKTVYFCCGGCLEKFRAEPEKFSRSGLRRRIRTCHVGDAEGGGFGGPRLLLRRWLRIRCAGWMWLLQP